MAQDDANAPVVEETQEAPQEPETQEPEQQEPTSQTQEETSEEAESTEPLQESEQPAEQAEPEEEVDWSQYVPQLNQELPVNEQGMVDPVRFREQMKQELRFEQAQIRGWTRLEQSHPEIRSDAELRDMIVANQLYDVQRGGDGSLDGAANRVFTRLGVSESQGRAKQQTSIKVQKSAALQKPSAGGTSSNSGAELKDRIRKGDQSAIHAQLTSWIDNNSI